MGRIKGTEIIIAIKGTQKKLGHKCGGNMEYKRFNNMIVVRLDPGDEVLESIKKVATSEKVKLAKVEALGATNHFIVGAYSLTDKQYYKNEYNGDYEIVSLIGNINTMNGEFYTHIHMCAADKTGDCKGGHLNSAVISATCEMFITIIDGNVDRVKSELTGLNIFKF